ncbi:hypothetical protein DPMN_188293 [Dreissena polymorpha]|uniref:Uncharacterized protein n=1 Tax=Dreissena polymorpha TaxID=45954 RepID=A0A9D4DQM3_DREPO|nr:hypothetical protein DPMN_188293 [Dreissena polymorpha]
MLKLAQTNQQTNQPTNQPTDQPTNRQGKNNMSPTTIVGDIKIIKGHSNYPCPILVQHLCEVRVLSAKLGAHNKL